MLHVVPGGFEKNYRPVSLLPVVPNGFERIIGLLIYYLWSPTGLKELQAC